MRSIKGNGGKMGTGTDVGYEKSRSKSGFFISFFFGEREKPNTLQIKEMARRGREHW
jgi:hypothetical protein